VIPATKPKRAAQAAVQHKRRRVAGYARVSTDKEEQQNSYEAQLDYYTNYIKSRAEWEFVNVYTDEGISALNTKKREGFKQMMADALAGKIDLIITKSVSRFARNTVDSLTSIRQLKEKGVECYFEKENIWTFEGSGEIMLTIMASLAQEESRSISENVTWGKRKAMADGKIFIPWKNFLGYKKGKDGKPVIVPKEAEIVKTIYRLFMEGESYSAIARYLTNKGIPSPMGKAEWPVGTVKSILQNETYKGDKLLQKKFTVDFLAKKQKVNEGEIPQHYLTESHDAIIPPKEWEAVQVEIKRRATIGPRVKLSPFTSKIRCGGCGAWFGPKVWHSNSKYRRTVWQCNDRYKNKTCQTPHVTEAEIKAEFVPAVSHILENREKRIADYRKEQNRLRNDAAIEAEIVKLERIVTSAWEAIQNNATDALERLKQHDEAKERQAELERQKAINRDRADSLEAIIQTLERCKNPRFDERLWLAIVDYVEVGSDGQMTVLFKK